MISHFTVLYMDSSTIKAIRHKCSYVQSRDKQCSSIKGAQGILYIIYMIVSRGGGICLPFPKPMKYSH